MVFELRASLSDQIFGIISMLIEGGVDVNARFQWLYRIEPHQKTRADCTYRRGFRRIRMFNALELVFQLFWWGSIQTNAPSESVWIDNVLVQYGGEIAEEINISSSYNYLQRTDPWASIILIKNSGIALGQ